MKKSPLVLAVVFLAIFSLWFWRLSSTDPVTASRTNTQADPIVGENAERVHDSNVVGIEPTPNTKPGTNSDATIELEEREEVAAERTRTAAVIRGRCVDESGEPLSGMRVSITGFKRRGKDSDPQHLSPPPIRTKPTGNFEILIENPSPYQLDLDIRSPNHVNLTIDWEPPDPGLTVDLGDCVMVACECIVSGRVTDTNRVPRKGVVVQLFRAKRSLDREHGRLRTERIGPGALTKTDGTFALRKPVGPGDWDCRVSYARAQLVAPRTVVVKPKETTKFVELEIKSDSEIQSVRGVVVDVEGKPIAGAQIRYCDGALAETHRMMIRRGMGGKRETSDDGGFTVDAQANSDSKHVYLLVEKEGYDRLKPKKYVWGTSDLKLVLRRGTPVTICVTDAETNEPVEGFSVKLSPSSHRSSEVVIQTRQHEGGVLTTTRLAGGKYSCRIDPTDKTWMAARRTLDVKSGAPTTIRVALQRAAVRTLRVETAGGRRIAGTEVELVEHRRDRPINLTHYDGVLWCKGHTARDGELEIRAPRRTPLRIRILGPGHPPKVVENVKLETSPPTIVITVPAGASVHGTIGPARFLEQVFRMAERRMRDDDRPGIRLTRIAPNERELSLPINRFSSFPIEKDGTFDISGIGAGTWRLSLQWQQKTSRRNSSRCSVDLGLVTTLRDGERRTLEYDLPDRIFARVRGKVLLNGKPHRGQLVFVLDSKPKHRVSTNAGGEFDTYLPPGTYHPHVYQRSERQQVKMASNATLTLTPGQDAEHTVRVDAIRLHLRVTGSDGKPRKGIDLFAFPENENEPMRLDSSDDQGLVKSPLLKPGRVSIKVWPSRFADLAARKQFLRTKKLGPTEWASVLVPVSTVVAKKPSSSVVEVRLPESAGYK